MKFVATKKFFSLVLAICIVANTFVAIPMTVFASEPILPEAEAETEMEMDVVEAEEKISHAYQPFAAIKEYQYSERADEVDESSLLLKVSANAPAMSPIPEELAERGVSVVRTMVDATTPEAMEALGVTEPYRWLMVGFENEKATEIALSFADIPYVLDAEYNYTRQSSALPEADKNPLMSEQWHLQDESLQKAWGYLDDNDLRQNLEQTVVAVIDTGVDYTHPNLVNSMWVNVNEIPGNGEDDDKNGYVDDVYGISALGNIFDANGDPMDEMGHGTHVAGIIAASANSMGAVGVAYGSKIMAIKAGDSSGFFNDSDIIEGINYAILMGADVINMSFGSYARSAAIEDALALAYTSAILVAAAGNDGVDLAISPTYPASYNFVIGVMATDMNGSPAAFTNSDELARRDSTEYEICAPGVSIFSTLPANRYASWSGTSMACPYVSAVAAILRARFNDKSVYSTRYIMGQIVGTAEGSEGPYPQVDPYAALTDIPEPDVSFYDYYIFDDPAYSDKNNGDGIIDAGETIGLGVLIRNHWGQARNTRVRLISAANPTDATLCPHVTWIKDTVEYGDVGTFNSADNGFMYDSDGVITSIFDPFMFTVSESTPNDYHLPFSLVIECESYTDSEETKTFRFDSDSFHIQARKGVELPRLIDTDMTLTADKYYILAGSTLIETGVTVTVEPGTQIQFWGDYSKELYAGTDVAELLVDGELIIRGTADNPVDIFPSGSMSEMKVDIRTRTATGRIYMEYCNLANPVLTATTIDHCYFTQMMFDYMCELHRDMDGNWYNSIVVPRVFADEITNSIFYELGYRQWNIDYRLQVGGVLEGNLFDSCGLNFDTSNLESYRNNVFLKNYRLVESQIDDRTYLTSEFNIGTPYSGTNTMQPLYPVKNPETGSTYFVLHTPSLVLAEEFAKKLGGSVVRIDDEAEKAFILEYAKRYYAYNEELKDYTWDSRLNHLFVGFYANEQGSTYIGEGAEEDWLNFADNISIPMIGTSYYKPQNGEITREAWMSSFYTGDTYFVDAALSKNPSDNSYRDRGVIIEIPGEITPLSVSLECDALTIPSNTADYRVNAVVYPDTDNYTLSWATSDESVVQISADGKLTATGLGTATVTVTVDGMDLSATMILIVTQYYAPESISDTVSEIALNEYQQTVKLSPVVMPAEATAIVSYISSDTNVAVVGIDGTVTAISSGSTTVTAQVVGSDLIYQYTVNVAIPPSSIELKKDYLILSMNSEKKQSLIYSYGPAYATEGDVEYVSSDETVVRVSDKGELTPVAPGNAVVWISFPDIDRALQAKVIVMEDESSVNIVKGDPIMGWQGASVLYAEDGTTYILANEEMFGSSKLPQKFPHKTKEVVCVNGERWLYIDLENNLRSIYRNSSDEGSLIAEGVLHVWGERHSWNGSYYQKIDGTIWFYREGDSVQNEWLTDIVDAIPYGSDYIFLDSQGTLWYDDTPTNNGEPLTAMSFSTTQCLTDNRIVFLTSNGCFDEDGVFYHFYNYGESLTVEKQGEFNAARMEQELKITWDDVVDVERIEGGATSAVILLLDDGRVAYAGYYYPNETNTFAELISIPAYSGTGYCFLDLGVNVVSLGHGALITEDGSVLLYVSDYSMSFGNGKTFNDNKSLKRPASPWLGMEDDGQDIAFDTASFKNEQGISVTEELELQGLVRERVDPNSSIILNFSKPVSKYSSSGILIKDGFGVKVEVECSVDRFGKALTITPKTALQEGYDYTVSISAGSFSDEFGNLNRMFSFTFTAAGVAVYPVPVTGIIAEGDTEITLEYGESVYLDTTVCPADASMKKIYWSSTDEQIATVNSSGYVTGRYNGTAVITATTADGGHTVSFTVTVCTQPDEVSLATGYFHLEAGETGRIEISHYPAYADLGVLTYNSNNSSVATVDENGVVTAIGAGSTLVSVTSSTTGETYYALVDVVADGSSAEIVSVYRNKNNHNQAYFIAEDNSVWYVSTDSYGGENVYLPRKAGFKAKTVVRDSGWGYAYYISLDNKLYRTNENMQSSWAEQVSEDVVSVVSNGQHVFYVKSDGSTYYHNTNTAKSTKCSLLSGTSALFYYGSGFLFLNQNGVLRYVYGNALEGTITNSIFKTVEIPGGEKIVSLSHNYALGENGGIYVIHNSEENSVATEVMSAARNEEYGAICGQVVEICPAHYNGDGAFIVRTADGNVYFVGNANSLPIGLQDCVDVSDVTATSSMVARRIQGISNVVDIDIGYFVLSDGTVRAYICTQHEYHSSYKTMLANNNIEQKNYEMPVVSWFGAQGEYADITVEGAQITVGESKTDISVTELNEGLNTQSSFVLTFDKQLFSVLDGITLIDMGGVVAPVRITISDRSLIIMPEQALKTGTLYTLSVPSGSVMDIFRNTTQDIEINFTTEGELHFAIPVTGITDEIGQLSLSYDQERTLTPTIAPSDASMKRVSWTTSDPNVAVVTQDGTVIGRQNGTATITVTTFDGEYTYSYTVTVYTPVVSFDLSEDFAILDLSGRSSIQLVGAVTPSFLATSGLFTWKSADPEIATVSADGTVTAQKAGITAIYCYCEGIDEPAVCVISVVSNYDEVFINRVSANYNNGFLFEADDCIWLTNSHYMVPKKLNFFVPVSGEDAGQGEEALEPQRVDVSEMKQALFVPEYSYSSEETRGVMIFLQEDGTLLFYFSDLNEKPCHTESGVKKIAYVNQSVVMLMNDGSISVMRLHGRHLDQETGETCLSFSKTAVEEMAGFQDMVYQNNSSTLFLLQINRGFVWSYNQNNAEEPFQLVFSKEPITDITLGNGSFMRGESGIIYPLRGEESSFTDRYNEMKNSGFYDLDIEIADIVPMRDGYYGIDFLILTKDGKLACYSNYSSSSPLAEENGGYQWTRDPKESRLYYIETNKVIAGIGQNWILFADGTVRMFGENAYLGNAKYTEYNEYDTSLCSPYFTETEVDIHSLTLEHIFVGETEVDVQAEAVPVVEASNMITLEYNLPLVPTDQLFATAVTDSQGNFLLFDVYVEGKQIKLIFEEALTPGETYEVVLYSSAAQDIFHNKGSKVSFSISIADTSSEVLSYESSLYPTTDYSPDWTLKQLQSRARDFYDETLYEYIIENSDDGGNAFLNAFANPDTTAWMNIVAWGSINSIGSVIGNFWGTTKKDMIDRIIYDVNDSFNYGEIIYDPILETASEEAYPFVTSIIVKNSEGNIVSSVGLEEITVEVYFNRDMDTQKQPTVMYGSDYPFGDFSVTGDWKDARTWVGTTKISAVTGSGTQFFKVRGAVAADDAWLVTGNDYERFAFTIATSGAKSMSMQANGAEGHISLEWGQDDYETMAGYNIYRSELADGTYRKINKTLISHNVTAYTDFDVAPGVQYYYYFTVVGTDLKESEPSGIAIASAHDTTPPTVNHTAVVQAPVGAAISIVANVHDNLQISTVNLYYRVKGQTNYSCVNMYKNADNTSRYTATIPAGAVTLDGVEYYIEASDGRQSTTLYSAANPQRVSIYETFTISIKTVQGGRINIVKTRAKAGEYISVSVTADSGYAYLAQTLKYIENGTEHIISNGGFRMPAGDVTITATFVEESEFEYGDINRDGVINSADAILLLRYDAGYETFDQEQILLADVNRDGRITVSDANEILRIDVGL